jgi:GH35 family endo-1,4-beta-xylanase
MKPRNNRRVSLLATGLVATLLAAVAAMAAAPDAAPSSAPATAPVVDQNGPKILDTYKNLFFIGTAGDLPRGYSEQELNLIKETFNIVTPENCMKPQPTHPAEDQWNFAQPDALVQWCADNKIAVWGHTLVWHAQTANWFFEGGDKATITKRLQNHIATLVGRYKGKIRGWDVVNEAINDGGGRGGARGGTDAGDPAENLRNSSWLQNLGPDFFAVAFKAAHEADPDARLYYNDYNIENGAKHTASVALLKRLIKEGLPIAGVGIQGHWSTTGVPFAAIDKAISDYAALGLKVSITELDITINGTSGGQLNPGGAPGGAPGGGGGRGRRGGAAPGTAPASGPAGVFLMDDQATFFVAAPAAPAGSAPGGTAPGTGAGGRRGGGGGGFGGGGRGGGAPPSAASLKAQADAYARLFAIFIKHKDAIERVTFWGISDRRTWRAGQNPLIFDSNNQRKLCYVSIVDALLHPDPNLAAPQ